MSRRIERKVVRLGYPKVRVGAWLQVLGVVVVWEAKRRRSKRESRGKQNKQNRSKQMGRRLREGTREREELRC